MKDLTNLNIDRQNILNNHYALTQIQEYIGLHGMLFEGEYRFTTEMAANFFEIDISTIDRYLTKYEAELKHNGYILTKGKQLKDFKLQFDHLIDKANKTRQLGLFNFRALLNLSMLLVESENGKAATMSLWGNRGEQELWVILELTSGYGLINNSSEITQSQFVRSLEFNLNSSNCR